jgi:hypothetical protein
MATSRVESDLHVNGHLTSKTASLPAGTVTNAMVNASAAIAATKLQHQHVVNYSQADGTAVAAAIVPVWVCRGATATVVAVQVVCVDAPSGGDLTFTVDIHKGAVGTADGATILTGDRTYPNATADGTMLAGTISSGAMVAGDYLIVIVAVSGSTGTQGQGLVVTITVREDAE